MKGQQNSCSIEDQLDSVSISLKKAGFNFGELAYSFSTSGILVLSFVVGVIGGVYGIGGGSIIAPFLITFFNLPVYTIAGAVLLGTFTSSVAGVAFYSLIPINGTVAPPDWILGILFGAGGLSGMYFGAKTQKYIPENWIKIGLGIIVFPIATKDIWWFFSS